MLEQFRYPIISVHENDKAKASVFVNYLTRQSMWRVHQMPELEQYQDPIQPDGQIMAKMADDPSPENVEAFVEDVMRSNHYCLLNALPAVAGTKWPVTEAIYWHFLEILPPLDYPKKYKGFAISEAKTGDIRSAYYVEAGQYWHEYVSLEG